MNRLPRILELQAGSCGWGFYLCARKDLRAGRSGDYLRLVLQDSTGQIPAKIFQDVETLKQEFETGEFVKVLGRSDVYNQKLELVLEKIRRVQPERDRADGFREEDCIPCAPRPIADMWAELGALIDRELTDPHVRRLADSVLEEYGDRLQLWPAAQMVHHAYRGGLLEHVLQISRVALSLAETYGADRNLLLAGALLHDIGKLDELAYDGVTQYSSAGNLVGHIALGARLVRRAIDRIEGFPPELAVQIEHLVLSHHGSRELGSPVEPMTVEAFILAAIDDLDAKIHQVRRHVAEDEGEGEFTAYHPRLRRVLFKPSGR
jgi:3'-5' exoribonuclease